MGPRDRRLWYCSIEITTIQFCKHSIKIINLTLRRGDHLSPVAAPGEIRRTHNRRCQRIIAVNPVVNRRDSLAEKARNKNPRKRTQCVGRRILTYFGETNVNSFGPDTNGVTQAGVGIKANFNRRHTAVTAHMTKSIGEVFFHFGHCGNSLRQTAVRGHNLKDGGSGASTFGGRWP